MIFMKRGMEAVLGGAVLFAVLLLQFRHQLAPGHSLYLSIIEDPGARYSWFPWDHLAAGELRAGCFPLWDPYNGTGMPLLANFHSALLFPLKFFYYLFPHSRVSDLMVVLRLALAGAFTHLLARALGRSLLAAAFSAAAFALCGYLMKFSNVAHVANEMWLPLLLFLALAQERNRSFAALAGSALVWALVMMGGNPEAVFYTALITLLFVLCRGAGRPQFLGWTIRGFAAPFLAGGMIASVQALPFLEYLPHAWHVHDPGLHLAAETSPRFLWSLAAPWLLGPSGSHPGQLVSPPYVGAAVLLLAAIAVARTNRRTRSFLFLALAAALLLAVAYRLPPLGYLSFLPPFNRSGNIKFAFLPLSLIAAILAGAGLDAVRGPGFRARHAAIPLALVSLALIGGVIHCRLVLGKMAGPGLVPAFCALIICGLTLILTSGKRTVAVRVISLVAVLELLIHFLGFNLNDAMLPNHLSFPDPAVPSALEAAAKDPGRPRFTGVGGALHPNLNIMSRVADLRAFEAMYPKAYVRAMGAIAGFPPEQAVPEFFRRGWMFDAAAEELSHPLLDQLGVQYVVAYDELSVPGFEPAPDYPGGDYRLYQNREAYPRAWVEAEGERADAEYSLVNNGRIVVRAAGPGKLVVADTWSPGWEARAGGSEIKMESRKGLFRTVAIGPGPAEVEMTYRPRAFRIGLMMGLASLAAMLAIVWRRPTRLQANGATTQRRSL